MKRLTLVLVTMLIVSLLSCNDDPIVPRLDKEAFINGLINYNAGLVTLEIDKLTVDLKPKSDGHQTNLTTLIQRIEQQTESISVVNSCYACVYTLPPQSEIVLKVDSLGTQVLRTIDILTPEKDVLSCEGLHN